MPKLPATIVRLPEVGRLRVPTDWSARRSTTIGSCVSVTYVERSEPVAAGSVPGFVLPPSLPPPAPESPVQPLAIVVSLDSVPRLPFVLPCEMLVPAWLPFD